MTAPQRIIKTGVIGYGNSGRDAHTFNGIRKNPEFEVTAVCDLSDKNRERAAAELNCATYADYREMLEKEKLDLVSIISRSDTHAEIACAALEKGVHSVVTKPWALDLAEADQILAAAKSGSATVFPWIPMRWSPDYLKIRELLADHAIGDVFKIRRHITNFFRRHDWQTELKFGGGYLLNWGTHIVQPVVDLAESPVQSVYGKLQQVINPGDGDDNFLAVLQFKNGIHGIAEFSQAVEGLPWFMLQGTKGMIHSNAEQITLIQVDPDKPGHQQRSVFSVPDKVFGDEAKIYADVATALLEGKPFPASAEDAHYGTRVLDAIRESHNSGQPVSLG